MPKEIAVETESQDKVEETTTEGAVEEGQKSKSSEVETENFPSENVDHDATEVPLQAVSNQPLGMIPMVENVESAQIPQGIVPPAIHESVPSPSGITTGVVATQDQVLFVCIVLKKKTISS